MSTSATRTPTCGECFRTFPDPALLRAHIEGACEVYARKWPPGWRVGNAVYNARGPLPGLGRLQTPPKPATAPARPQSVDFGGAVYDPAYDEARLEKQLGRVWAAVAAGRWLTLEEIAAAAGDPITSISARLRDLRKPQFGGHIVERRARGERERGLFEYRLAEKP